MEYDNTADNLKNIELATHLYRIAYEATKNAVIHGDAENVTISLKSDKNYLYLDIGDDGTGITDSAIDNGGMGINIMPHRIELIGGTFEIKKTSDLGDTGVTVTCKISIQEYFNATWYSSE